MAETADNPNTDECGLLCDEYLFVLKACKSQAITKKLLRQYLAEWRIRWRYWELEYLTGHVDRAYQFFWIRDEHSTVDIDWLNSSATRSGPPWQVVEAVDDDGNREVFPRFLLHYPRMKLSLIRLDHADVLAMLREVGLMPPEPTGPKIVEPSPEATKETAGEARKGASKVPKEWLRKAIKDYPQQRDEQPAVWASVTWRNGEGAREGRGDGRVPQWDDRPAPA